MRAKWSWETRLICILKELFLLKKVYYYYYTILQKYFIKLYIFLLILCVATAAAKKLGAEYMEISAKTGHNVDEVFFKMAQQMYLTIYNYLLINLFFIRLFSFIMFIYWQACSGKKDIAITSTMQKKYYQSAIQCEAIMCTIKNKKNILKMIKYHNLNKIYS